MSYSLISPAPSVNPRADSASNVIPFPGSDHGIAEEDSPPYDAEPPTDPVREWRPMMPPDVYSPEIGPDGAAVYGVLCLFVDGKTGECWPSQSTIGQRIGISRERVIRAIRVLEMHGFVAVEHQANRGMKRTNKYRLPHQDTRVRTDVPNPDSSCPKLGQQLSQNGTADVPNPDTNLTSIELESNAPLYPPKAKPKADRRRPEVPLPSDFDLSEKRLSYAVEKGLDEQRSRRQFERFCNHAMQNDRRLRDWDFAWRNWVLGEIERNGVSPPTMNGHAAPVDEQVRRNTEAAKREMRRLDGLPS